MKLAAKPPSLLYTLRPNKPGVSMPRAGPKKVQEYSAEFKLAAVRLSRQQEVQVQARPRDESLTAAPTIPR